MRVACVLFKRLDEHFFQPIFGVNENSGDKEQIRINWGMCVCKGCTQLIIWGVKKMQYINVLHFSLRPIIWNILIFHKTAIGGYNNICLSYRDQINPFRNVKTLYNKWVLPEMEMKIIQTKPHVPFTEHVKKTFSVIMFLRRGGGLTNLLSAKMCTNFLPRIFTLGTSSIWSWKILKQNKVLP